MARTRHAQAALFNTISIGGLADIETIREFGRVASGSLDGLQGAPFATATGDKSVRGTINHEDCEKFIDVVNSTPGTGVWYEKNVGAVTFTQRQLLKPVFGAFRLDVRIGGKMRASQQFECQFGAAEDFDDVDSAPDEAVAAATVEAALVKPVSVGELIAATFDPGESPHDPITLSHKQGCNIALAGEFVTDSDPGEKGRTCVEFNPGLLTFSITYRDTDLDDVSGDDLAQQLLARDPATLELEFDVKEGAVTNTKISLVNAKFVRGPRRSPARGFIEYTVDGRCEWADADGTFRTLGGSNKLVAVTKATFE